MDGAVGPIRGQVKALLVQISPKIRLSNEGKKVDKKDISRPQNVGIEKKKVDVIFMKLILDKAVLNIIAVDMAYKTGWVVGLGKLHVYKIVQRNVTDIIWERGLIQKGRRTIATIPFSVSESKVLSRENGPNIRLCLLPCPIIVRNKVGAEIVTKNFYGKI